VKRTLVDEPVVAVDARRAPRMPVELVGEARMGPDESEEKECEQGAQSASGLHVTSRWLRSFRSRTSGMFDSAS